ncbi:hypothetical protein ADUPG1_008801 [Aduncisulcus paluster]|uniref:Uncharacterized protein n=1 Tax=Aduncisulcus paluster TaxID=2918883 RepID=A0ABQ5KTA8_9EUKA|nr:hypothetical protein ADUPG1_008801 [Aduncisulcus paluster]
MASPWDEEEYSEECKTESLIITPSKEKINDFLFKTNENSLTITLSQPSHSKFAGEFTWCPFGGYLSPSPYRRGGVLMLYRSGQGGQSRGTVNASCSIKLNLRFYDKKNIFSIELGRLLSSKIRERIERLEKTNRSDIRLSIVQIRPTEKVLLDLKKKDKSSDTEGYTRKAPPAKARYYSDVEESGSRSKSTEFDVRKYITLPKPKSILSNCSRRQTALVHQYSVIFPRKDVKCDVFFRPSYQAIIDKDPKDIREYQRILDSEKEDMIIRHNITLSVRRTNKKSGRSNRPQSSTQLFYCQTCLPLSGQADCVKLTLTIDHKPTHSAYDASYRFIYLHLGFVSWPSFGPASYPGSEPGSPPDKHSFILRYDTDEYQLELYPPDIREKSIKESTKERQAEMEYPMPISRSVPERVSTHEFGSKAFANLYKEDSFDMDSFTQFIKK